jgi:hypothetical protein
MRVAARIPFQLVPYSVSLPHFGAGWINSHDPKR